MSASLRGESLTFAYDSGVSALENVSVELCAGEMCGIVGPNGSGKSTLMRILAGQLSAQSGTVRLNGAPMQSVSPKERGRTLAYLPQSVQPVFSLPVRGVVALGRYPYAGLFGVAPATSDDEAVAKCLGMTRCEHLRDRSFDTLSGGERQRVLLASALAQEPELMLLDEATAALDLHHQEEIFALLKGLVINAGYGVAVITHDLNLAGRFCDRLLLLDTGHRVAAYGAPEDTLRADTLSAAYGGRIEVGVNPLTGTPLVQACLDDTP